MTRSRIVAALAFLVALATLARATRCSSGAEVLAGVILASVLTGLWNDDSERGLGGRTAKFIVVGLLAGAFVGFFAVALHVRCVAVVSPAGPGAAAVV
jgi:hypothetical protein